jgi:mannose-6-phosphate isomerase
MGAHPGAPSRLLRDGVARGLDEVVAADPDAELGAAVAAEYGPRLPFLLKLLAAEAPLSIQAHPDAAQAAAGFAAEEAAGIPRDDPRRNYVDPHHKPELLCALSDFEVLCGFREPAETLAILDRLDAPLLAGSVAPLRARPDAEGLRTTLTGLLTLADADREKLVAEVVGAARRLDGLPYRTAVELGEQCPGDIGVVVALLFNQFRLAPGEAIFVAAGMPHAYLRGVGMEVLASSDNVIRAGLTPKHVDAGELLRLLRFEPGPVEPYPFTEPAPGVRQWRPPVGEFTLTRVELADAAAPMALAADGPRILFCLAGAVLAADGTGSAPLRSGEAVFVPAGRHVTVAGRGVLFQATTA